MTGLLLLLLGLLGGPSGGEVGGCQAKGGIGIWLAAAAMAGPGPGSGGRKRTLYDVLGVAERATQAEIRRIFRRKAVRSHPDKLGPFEDPEEEKKVTDAFVQMLKAYETLSDPDRRRRYDQSGMPHEGEEEEGPASRFEAGGIVYSDKPFSMFVRFGGGRGGMWFRYSGRGAQRSADVEIPLYLSLEEAFEGVTRNVTVTRTRLCPACQGTGSSTPDNMPTCELCTGKGYAFHLYSTRGEEQEEDEEDEELGGHWHGETHRSDGDATGCDGHRGGLGSYVHTVNTTCKVCGGLGKLSDHACPICSGNRATPNATTLEVTMPPGTTSGHKVTFAGEGHQFPNQQAGAVRVVAWLNPHPRFRLEGVNLVYDAKISLVDALVGFQRRLTLLSGSERLLVSHDEVTFSGYRQHFQGLGFPVPVAPAAEGLGTRGDLIVDFQVVFPKTLTAAQLKVLEGVLSEEELGVLEDVLRLVSQKELVQADPEELKHCSVCGYDLGSEEPHWCIPDPLSWAWSEAA